MPLWHGKSIWLQEIVWLMSALGIAPEDFAQALSDLLTQDARLEARTFTLLFCLEKAELSVLLCPGRPV